MCTVSFSSGFYIVLRPQGIRNQMKTLRKRHHVHMALHIMLKIFSKMKIYHGLQKGENVTKRSVSVYKKEHLGLQKGAEVTRRSIDMETNQPTKFDTRLDSPCFT